MIWLSISWAASAENLYFNAENCYNKLLKNSKKQKYKQSWMHCINKFYDTYRYDPSGRYAAAGLYKTGELYLNLYKFSGNEHDKQKASDIFHQIVKNFPKSLYKIKAEKIITENSLTYKKKSIPHKKVRYRKKQNATSKNFLKPIPGYNTIIKKIRFKSNPDYTRIVIDTNKKVSYTYKPDKKKTSKKNRHIYMELLNSRLAKTVIKKIPIHDKLLSHVQAVQFLKNLVKVTIYLKSFNTFKIFSLKNPSRIVIDIWNKSSEKQNIDKPYPASLAKQFALGVDLIVIDPGHGGHDYGAPGYVKGVYEKNVVLQIAKRLAKKIQEKLHCKVILTRNIDKFLTLEKRTEIANSNHADLFISIHTNASKKHQACGIETYFLNLAVDKESIRVAARENAPSTKNMSDLQVILNNLMENSKINESNRLASHVQNNLCNYLKKYYIKINNKGVKQAPFYVLLGAKMPSILIETSFISNKRECKRLQNSLFLDRLCESITIGIKKYIMESDPTAFLKNRRIISAF